MAALLCLGLALLSAVSTHGKRSTERLAPGPGQVAIRVELADGGAEQHFLHAGDHINLLAGAPANATSTLPDVTTNRVDGVLVLDVRPPPSAGLTGDGREPGTVLIIAADSDRSDVITSLAGRQVLAAQDKPP